MGIGPHLQLQHGPGWAAGEGAPCRVSTFPALCFVNKGLGFCLGLGPVCGRGSVQGGTGPGPPVVTSQNSQKARETRPGSVCVSSAGGFTDGRAGWPRNAGHRVHQRLGERQVLHSERKKSMEQVSLQRGSGSEWSFPGSPRPQGSWNDENEGGRRQEAEI